jgi:hypothetical protein
MSGYPPEITLIENNLLNEELTLLSLWDAKVTITAGDKVYTLKNIFYRKKERQVFINYKTDDTLRVPAGVSISLLVVTKDNDTLTSTTKSLGNIHIDAFEAINNTIKLQLNNAEGNGSFYRISISGFSADTIMGSQSSFYDYSLKPTSTLEFEWPKKYIKADSLEVKIFAIHKEYYDYMQSVNNATSAYYDPFMTPEMIKSNITGGIGIFTYYTMGGRIVMRRGTM